MGLYTDELLNKMCLKETEEKNKIESKKIFINIMHRESTNQK